MNFVVDLATQQKPKLNKIEKDSFIEFTQEKKDIIAWKAWEKYDEMIKTTFIITILKFSKQANENIYGNDKIKATIIYPPVDICKFKKFSNNVNNNSDKYHKAILVVSRIHPTKTIEKAIEIGKILKEKENVDYYNMTIVGNLIQDDKDYFNKLNNLIAKCNL